MNYYIQGGRNDNKRAVKQSISFDHDERSGNKKHRGRKDEDKRVCMVSLREKRQYEAQAGEKDDA